MNANITTRNDLIDQLFDARRKHMPNAAMWDLSMQLVHACRAVNLDELADERGVVDQQLDHAIKVASAHDPLVKEIMKPFAVYASHELPATKTTKTRNQNEL